MATITFDGAGDLMFLYNKNNDWKEYICEDFDEKVIVIGNRKYSSIEEASWWNKAKELIADLDNYDWDIDDLMQYEASYTKDRLERVYKAYQNCKYSDDTDFIVEVAQIIIPGLELEHSIARGYTQSDWVEIVFVKDAIKVDTFAAYFFGQLTEIHVESDDDDYWDHMPDSEVYELFNNSNVEKALRDRYNLKDDESINIIKNN